MELFIAITLCSSKLVFFKRVGERELVKEGSVSNMANSRSKVIARLSGLPLLLCSFPLRCRPTERPSGMSGGVKTNELPRPLRRPFPPRESQARARALVSARCDAAVRHILFNLSVCAELPSSLANMLTELNWPWPPRPPSAGRIPC